MKTIKKYLRCLKSTFFEFGNQILHEGLHVFTVHVECNLFKDCLQYVVIAVMQNYCHRKYFLLIVVMYKPDYWLINHVLVTKYYYILHAVNSQYCLKVSNE